MNDLKVGDFIGWSDNGESGRYEVRGVCGKVVFISQHNSDGSTQMTRFDDIDDLINYGYKKLNN